MMEPVLRIDGTNASAVRGRPVLDVPKAAWNGGMLLIALVLGPLSFSWSAFGLFIVVTYLSLLVGHSVGMHRMMIHRTFACSKPLSGCSSTSVCWSEWQAPLGSSKFTTRAIGRSGRPVVMTSLLTRGRCPRTCCGNSPTDSNSTRPRNLQSRPIFTLILGIGSWNGLGGYTSCFLLGFSTSPVAGRGLFGEFVCESSLVRRAIGQSPTFVTTQVRVAGSSKTRAFKRPTSLASVC